MKKQKREKLLRKKEKKRKEWQRVRELQEMEKIYDQLDCHFDLTKYAIKLRDGGYEIDLRTAIDDLTCEKCSHFMEECKGKGLKRQLVVDCLLEEKHKDCLIGLSFDDDWEDLEKRNLE